MRARRDWFLVLLVLAMAMVAIIGILAPRVLDPRGPQGHLSAAAGASAAAPERAEAAPAPTAEEKEAAASAEAAATDGDLPPHGDHSLLHSEAIQGTVTDKEGKPVADAIVVAAYKETQSRPYEIHLASRVRSEQDGYFILGPLERKSYGILAIKEKEGVAYASGKMPGSWVDLALAPGARLIGTVTSREEREPVAGATVIVRDYVFHQETVTDEKGAYSLAPLPASVNTWGGHEVVVVADGFQRAERSNLLLKSDKEHRVDFALVAGGSLHGKVVDARTLKPIEKAIVAEGWEHYHRTAESGEDGAFVLPNVDVAPNRVFTVRAEGYLSQQRQSDGSGEIQFELDSSLVLGGLVVDQQEKPVPGSKIYLHRIKYAPGFKPARTSKAKTFTESDEKGEFTFADVLPGQVALVAFHKEHAPGEQGPIEVPVGGPAPDGNKVFLRQGLTVDGEVRDLHDRPIPSVQVSMWRGWGTRLEGYKWLGNYMWSENPIWFSDENGHFSLKGAVPGSHWLSAWDQTFGYTST
ncbi:MAG: carboxypeptidase regulatory-like domain-containing protein, partial [Planctomycetota bacterium]